MAEMIAEMWEDVGVNVVVEMIDSEVRLRKYRQQTSRLSWSGPTRQLEPHALRSVGTGMIRCRDISAPYAMAARISSWLSWG